MLLVRLLAKLLTIVGTAAVVAHASAQAPAGGDARQLVALPEPMRTHTIANMRDHLLALQEIDEALSKGDFTAASRIAEERIGMSSLKSHGAAHIASFLPPPMQEIGTRMHRAASRFAVEAQNASVANDLRPALLAKSAVIRECVACHAAYRYH
jgi:hypothetical protein